MPMQISTDEFKDFLTDQYGAEASHADKVSNFVDGLDNQERKDDGVIIINEKTTPLISGILNQQIHSPANTANWSLDLGQWLENRGMSLPLVEGDVGSDLRIGGVPALRFAPEVFEPLPLGPLPNNVIQFPGSSAFAEASAAELGGWRLGAGSAAALIAMPFVLDGAPEWEEARDQAHFIGLVKELEATESSDASYQERTQAVQALIPFQNAGITIEVSDVEEIEKYYRDALKQGVMVVDPWEFATKAWLSARIANIQEQLRQAREGGMASPGLEDELQRLLTMARGQGYAVTEMSASGLSLPANAHPLGSVEDIDLLRRLNPNAELYFSSRGVLYKGPVVENSAGTPAIFGSSAVNQGDGGALLTLPVTPENLGRIFMTKQDHQRLQEFRVSAVSLQAQTTLDTVQPSVIPTSDLRDVRAMRINARWVVPGEVAISFDQDRGEFMLHNNGRSTLEVVPRDQPYSEPVSIRVKPGTIFPMSDGDKIVTPTGVFVVDLPKPETVSSQAPTVALPMSTPEPLVTPQEAPRPGYRNPVNPQEAIDVVSKGGQVAVRMPNGKLEYNWQLAPRKNFFSDEKDPQRMILIKPTPSGVPLMIDPARVPMRDLFILPNVLSLWNSPLRVIFGD